MASSWRKLRRSPPREERLPQYSVAHVFRPPREYGPAIEAGISAVALVLGLALIVRGAMLPVSFAAFGCEVLGWLLLIPAGMFAYWAYALYDLRYIVDDDSMTIVWGVTRLDIPVGQIYRIVRGQKYGEPRLNRIRLPGGHIGFGRVTRVGDVLFYSTHRTPADLIYVTTPVATFGLSLVDAYGFARTIQEAQARSAESERMPVVSHFALPVQGFLRDRGAAALTGLAVLAFLVAAGVIYGRYQTLPARLPLPYPPVIGSERLGQRRELLGLPLSALVWLLVSLGLAVWARTRLRALCYTLLAGTLFAECLYALGAVLATH